MTFMPNRHEQHHPPQNNVIKTARLIRRAGTRGGKLPWHDVRNALLWRHLMQLMFVLINLYIGVAFYFWVRFYETGGGSMFVERPVGIEGWLPIAGLMNLKYTLTTGHIPPIHGASMLLLIAFLAMSLLLKKAFCSWVCPIGTLSEWIGKLGNKLFGRAFHLPRGFDIALRSLKYLLLAFFLYLVIPMPASAIQGFLMSPYGLIADVKMLNFFRYIGQTTLIVLAVFMFGSLFIPHFWCRYFCPYGALVGLFSLLSPFKVRRNRHACIDCGKCSNACPSRIPVDRLISVRTIECTACLSCVEACPVQDTLVFSLTKPTGNAGATQSAGLPGFAVMLILTAILSAAIGMAHLLGHWETTIPAQFYERFIPVSERLGHP